MATRAPRTLALALALCGAAALPAPAGAHDCVVACASRPGHVSVTVQSQVAAIAREEGAGRLARLALLASAAVGGGVTVSASVPTYDVAFAGRRRAGLGDVSIAATRAVVQGDGSFYLALGGHLPTGDAAAGLGAGHAMAMLGAGATFAPGARLRLGVDLLDAVAPVVNASHDHAVQLAEPHSMHELYAEGWASLRLRRVSLRAGFAAQTALASGAGLRTALTPTAAIGLGLGGGWSATAGVLGPAAGRGWFGWRSGIAVTRSFGAPGCDEVLP